MELLTNPLTDRREEEDCMLVGVSLPVGGEYSPRVPSPPPAVPGVPKTFYFIFTFQSRLNIIYRAAPLSNIYNQGDWLQTFTLFIKNVIDEVFSLFPSLLSSY